MEVRAFQLGINQVGCLEGLSCLVLSTLCYRSYLNALSGLRHNRCGSVHPTTDSLVPPFSCPEYLRIPVFKDYIVCLRFLGELEF